MWVTTSMGESLNICNKLTYILVAELKKIPLRYSIISCYDPKANCFMKFEIICVSVIKKPTLNKYTLK